MFLLMSPLEVYHHHGEDVIQLAVVKPGKTCRLSLTGQGRKFLLECAADDSHSSICEIEGDFKAGKILMATRKGQTRTIYQGQALTLTFNRGTRRESEYILQQTATVQPWQRTGRSR